MCCNSETDFARFILEKRRPNMEFWGFLYQVVWLVVVSSTVYYVLSAVVPQVYSHASDLRSVVHELKRAKAAALESARTLRASNDELHNARTRVTALSAEVNTANSELLATRADLERSRAEIDALRLRIAASEARQEELTEAAEKASVVRWELASRFSSNEEARTAALNDLRRPPHEFVLKTSPPLGKTNSDTTLLAQRPDLSVSDSEEDETADPSAAVQQAYPDMSASGEDDAHWVAAVRRSGRSQRFIPDVGDTTREATGQRHAPHLIGLNSYPPATLDARMQRGFRRPRKRHSSGRRTLPPFGKVERSAITEESGELASDEASGPGDHATDSARGFHAPRLVALQRAPWTASAEASEARRGLAMEALVQPIFEKRSSNS